MDAQGLLDTGSSITVIDADIIHVLGLTPTPRDPFVPV
jgi:hypothetical protein